MDTLKTSSDLDQFVAKQLYVPNRPHTAVLENIDRRNDELINEFAERRGSLRSTASFGGDIMAAMPRFHTPFQYFEQSKIPYDAQDEKQRAELYRWLQHIYNTHHLVPILVDIFTRFPLVGIEFHSRDKQLKEFYEQLFMEDLNYEHFLTDLGRMYWTVGNAFALGHFNNTLGTWEDEELLDPATCKVRRYPIIGGEQVFLSADGLKDLKEIVDKREPQDIYYLLEKNYPEFIPFLKNGKDMPVSDVLLKHVAFKTHPMDVYGTPLLLRGLRTLMNEERLMASQDAIAERLYSPLVLVKLGVQDMGQGRGPWIPGPGEVSHVRNEMDMALASDFRLMVHHFGIEVQSVFGREQMPRLGDDFDRIERRIMQIFGVNPSLLSGGAASQPYASSALQAEFLNQILRTYQGYLKRHYESRAKIVAEAQGHFAYEKRGETRVPIKEEVLVYDPESGEEKIEVRNKLMIPEMRMKVLDLRDEATQRQFLQSLKQQGVPIPDQDIAMGMHYDFEEALGRSQEEMIQKTVATQEAKVKTYDILTAKGLPIPQDLKAEVEGQALGGEAPPGGTQVGIEPPGVGEIIMPPAPGGTPAIGPRSPQRGQRPEESDERSPIPPPGQVPTTGPQIPGVPGQPGMAGIPGAPRPAIGPPPGGARASTDEDDSTTPILERLPRKSADIGSIKKLQTTGKFATIDTNEKEKASDEQEDDSRGRDTQAPSAKKAPGKPS